MPSVQLDAWSQLLLLFAGLIYVAAFALSAIDLGRSSRLVQRVALVGAARRSGDVGIDGPAAPDAGFRYTGARRPIASVAVLATVWGFALHLAAVVLRGFAAERVPWANMYEFAISGALVIVAVYLVSLVKLDLRFLGAFILPLVIVIVGSASITLYVPVSPLVPALQSYWIIVHVAVAVLGTATFALAAAMSVLQLLQLRSERLGHPVARFLNVVPPATSLESLVGRFSAVGFIFWSFTLIFGAVWANEAWGRYWGWDTKEVWAFIIWVVYAGFLHARTTRGWQGSRLAVLNIIGFACILINFTVVNLFFKGLHAYSGLLG